MASRSGPRALGTDGSDYKHRETVASHYSKSADLKVSVRKCLMPHMLLTALYIGKYIAVMLGSKYFVPLASWEIVWLVSGICAFIGYSSLSRNDIPRLLVYIVGNIVFGLVPLVFGVNQLINQVKKDFSNMKQTPENWKNSPMKMAIVAVCVTWQIAGIVQGVRLANTWKSMGSRKKKY